MSQCKRCHTTDPDRFDSPTGAFCRECFSWIISPGRRFMEWAERAIDEKRGRTRGPFTA